MRAGWILLGLCACATYDKQISAHQAAYGADTLLQEKMLDGLPLEPSHGQVTVAVTERFAEKILSASLRPNQLELRVASRGRAWKSEGARLGIHYDNGVWLNRGQLDVRLEAGGLTLDEDTVTLRVRVHGGGAVNADLRFFGLTLTRDVDLVLDHDEPLQLKLEAGPGGWALRPVGPPLHASVQVKLPALTLAGVDLYQIDIHRSLDIELAQLRTWPVPLPAPREVDVGPERVKLGLQNYKFGARAGRLWLGADLTVEGAEPAKVSPAN